MDPWELTCIVGIRACDHIGQDALLSHALRKIISESGSEGNVSDSGPEGTCETQHVERRDQEGARQAREEGDITGGEK